MWGIGGTLGSQAAISVAGMLLASILITLGYSVLFGFALVLLCSLLREYRLAALLAHPLYGINKNSATPSWCLWSCAITASLWLILYLAVDVWRQGRRFRFLAMAGQNVLLAYLFHNMLYPAMEVFHFSDLYYRMAGHSLAGAMGRSILAGIVILSVATMLNRAGFRLNL